MIEKLESGWGGMDLFDKVGEIIDAANAQEKRVAVVERVMVNEIAAQLPELKERLDALTDDLHKSQFDHKLRGIQSAHLNQRLESQAEVWRDLSRRLDALEKRRDTLSSSYEAHFDLHVAEAKRVNERLNTLEKRADAQRCSYEAHLECHAEDEAKTGRRLDALEEKHPMLISLDEERAECQSAEDETHTIAEKCAVEIMRWEWRAGYGHSGEWVDAEEKHQWDVDAWHPETDVAQAFSVLEKAREKRGSYRVFSPDAAESGYCAVIVGWQHSHCEVAPTLALAACQAAIWAAEQRE